MLKDEYEKKSILKKKPEKQLESIWFTRLTCSPCHEIEIKKNKIFQKEPRKN
jgi:hypothetical protein